MNNVPYQYSRIAAEAADIAEGFLDLEGGHMTLAILAELLQELVEEGETSAALIAAKSVYEAAGSEFAWELENGQGTVSAHITLFVEVLFASLAE